MIVKRAFGRSGKGFRFHFWEEQLKIAVFQIWSHSNHCFIRCCRACNTTLQDFQILLCWQVLFPWFFNF